jgi:hypothetical protein
MVTTEINAPSNPTMANVRKLRKTLCVANISSSTALSCEEFKGFIGLIMVRAVKPSHTLVTTLQLQ